MPVKFLFLPFKGMLEFVFVPGAGGSPPVGGTALFEDGTNIAFMDGTDMDWIT